MTDRYASLKQSLVGCWIPSISGSGLLLPDLSGRGNSGALTNMDASDWVSGQYGRALDFDYVAGATRQAVELSNNVSVRGLATASLSLWCNLQAAPANNAGLFYESTASNGFTKFGIFQTPANALLFVARDTSSGSSFSITHTPAASQWLHVVGNYNSNSDVMELFVNGVSVGTNTTAKGVFVNEVPATTIAIGAYTDSTTAFNYSCNALVDDIRIYNRALSESEIRLLASEPGIGFKRRASSVFAKRYTYNPPKAKVFEGVRVRDHDYSSLRNGLVGAWCPSLANGGSGNTLPDQSGRGNHGTLTNMSAGAWVSSGSGRALEFDGVDDYAIANRPTFPVATTFSCWVKPTTGALSGLMSTRDTVSLLGVDFYLNSNGTVVFYCPSDNVGSNRSFFTTTNAVASGQWVHLVGRWQSSTLNDVWVNGSEAAGILTGTIQSTLTPRNNLRFACLGVLSFLTGCLDDIRVYDRVLSPSEIRLLASRPGIGLQPSPTRFIAREKKTGLRRKILTGQT